MTTTEIITTFLTPIFPPDRVIELRVIDQANGYARSSWYGSRELDRLAASATASNTSGKNVYFGMNPRPHDGATGDACIREAFVVCFDMDEKHLVTRTPKEQIAEAVKRAADAWLPPLSILHHTGHGVHGYWLLDHPLTDLRRWAALQDGIIGLLNSDRVIKNPERIMRLPGLINHKPPVAECVLVHLDADARYTPEDFKERMHHSNVADDDLEQHEAKAESLVIKHQPAVSGGNASVIEEFNRRTIHADLLFAAKYDIVGHRFRRPGKPDRGFSGIIRENSAGNTVSAHWSTNDKLNDGKFGGGTVGIHDSFDVFCLLAHNGNVTAAVKDAAARLGIKLAPHKRDSEVMELAANASDGETFAKLFFGEWPGIASTSHQADAMMHVLLRRHTSNPKQIERIMELSRGNRRAVAA